VDLGWVQSLEAGARLADHKRTSGRWGPAYRDPITVDPTTGKVTTPTPTPTTGWVAYPGDFGSGLGGGYWDNSGFTFTPEATKAYTSANTKETSKEWERRVGSEIDMRERQASAYVMANLEGERRSGNVGVRYVRTTVDARIATPIPVDPVTKTRPCDRFPPDACAVRGLPWRNQQRGRRECLVRRQLRDSVQSQERHHVLQDADPQGVQ
jgi:iron complex outermembrane receptor protein